MKRNRRNIAKNSTKKERAIMIASSAFVLAALTMTGVYMRFNGSESEDDGYSLDLVEMQESAGNKAEEIAQQAEVNVPPAQNSETIAQNDDNMHVDELPQEELAQGKHVDDALDFMPPEAETGVVEIPDLAKDTNDADAVETQQTQAVTSANITNALQFQESDGLLKPISGEVLLPFSMDGSIYFATLDQYKYNPALMLYAEVGSEVLACADAKVIHIFQNEEIGNAITFELGNGYEITYGQLENISVSEGDYVQEGELIATVAVPTKYFSVEGSNLYLKLTAEGIAVNPEVLFR